MGWCQRKLYREKTSQEEKEKSERKITFVSNIARVGFVSFCGGQCFRRAAVCKQTKQKASINIFLIQLHTHAKNGANVLIDMGDMIIIHIQTQPHKHAHTHKHTTFK